MVDFCPQRIGLDHHVGGELRPVRSGDDGLGGHEDQASVVGSYGDAEPAGGEALGGDEFFQQEDVAFVLFDGRGDAEGMGAAFEGEFSAVVDGHFVGEILRFDDVDFEETVNQQVVDLGHAALVFDAQVVEYAPVIGFAEIEVDVVGAVLLSRYPGLHGPQLAFDEKALAWSVRLLQQRIKFGNIPVLWISTLDDHSRSPDCGAWNIFDKISSPIAQQECMTQDVFVILAILPINSADVHAVRIVCMSLQAVQDLLSAHRIRINT